jgi:uncharacterized protein (DUF362 family)
MRKATVAILRTRPETVVDDYGRLFDLAGVRKSLDPKATTILKDNISWHLPMPGANTTPWQLEGTIRALRAAGYGDLVCVENVTVVTNAHKGERLNRYRGVLNEHRVPILYNFYEEDMRWEIYEPRAEMLVLKDIFPAGIRIPDYFHGKNVVHLPTVKTHIYTTTTGAMKNAFGGLLSTNRHYTHSWIHKTLVDLLAIQKEIHAGLFACMDGTTAGNGPGPRTLQPVEKDVLLASGDCVAIDAVAAKIMGFAPLSLEYIAVAHERGLGVGDPRDIDVVGDADAANENWGFTVGDNLASTVGDALWFGPGRALQHLFFRTSMVQAFVTGSDVYHDRWWWPAHGRRIYEEWRKGKWGRLFERYR